MKKIALQPSGNIRNQQKLWGFFAPVYPLFMRSNQNAYHEMYQKIRKRILKKEVLEVATGTGYIARSTAACAKKYIATDFSEQMLYQAQRGKKIENLYFMQADACALPFADKSFDVVIIANALHVMPDPAKALAEAARVLKTGGVLIAPCFMHEHMTAKGQVMTQVMSFLGVTQTGWNTQEYLAFLKKNRFHVRKKATLDAMMPLLYTECTYR